MRPTTCVVAADEPEIAAKIEQPTTFTCRSRPGSRPVHGASPWNSEREEYALEYGTAVLEVHKDAIDPGERVLIVDDVLATGGTAEATADLVRRAGAEVAGIAVILELEFLGGRGRLPGQSLRSLLVV